MLLFLATKLRCVRKNLLVISDDDRGAVIIINDVTDDDIHVRYSLNRDVVFSRQEIGPSQFISIDNDVMSTIMFIACGL